MPKQPVQNLQHHTKWDLLTHFILGPLFIINFLIRIYYVIKHPGWMNGWEGVVALALLVLNVKVRVYALGVQDRVIRLEERLRLARLVPDSLRPAIDQLTTPQLIALRFASDAELAPLVQRVVSDNMNPRDIKKAIQVWRPDYQRV